VFDTEIAGPGNAAATQGIRLQHRQNYVSFDFQAIAFHQQEDLQYAYMLEGIDPDWIESGNRHFANYQALPPGEYRFKVKVSDGQNGWEPNEISIPVVIVPAWWQTWAFRIFLAVLILLGIAWLIRFYATRKLRKRLERLEQMQEIERIRNRIARDIHDEIGSGLSKIALLSGTLERKSQGDDELLKASSRVRSLSREVIRSMGEIIWAVNPGNDSVASLLSFVRSYINQFSEESGISVRAELSTASSELNQAPLRPELKRNLLMVLKESLNNILKHAQATEIQVHLEFQPNRIRLLVHDNGKGIQGSPDFRHGNGMKNMHKRALELQGSLDIDSSDGMRILLDIPWNPQLA
jgi:signal transduction histidine kinase